MIRMKTYGWCRALSLVLTVSAVVLLVLFVF